MLFEVAAMLFGGPLESPPQPVIISGKAQVARQTSADAYLIRKLL